MIKLGLDLHGVIDVASNFFSKLANLMLDRRNEIFIVTGREETPELHDELRKCGMEWGEKRYGTDVQLYSSILSITTYQKKQGVPVHYLDKELTQPMMDPKIWNPTKAVLCASAGIDIMIDDSTLYESYFRDIKTQYIVYTPAMQELLNVMFF